MIDFPKNCPQCHNGYVEFGTCCNMCGYPQKDSIILHKVNNMETKINEIINHLPQEKEGISCRYAVISHGIGLSGKVEEITVHCKRESRNDYRESIEQPTKEVPDIGELRKILKHLYDLGEIGYKATLGKHEKDKHIDQAIQEISALYRKDV